MAHRGDERRSNRRNATGSWKQALIRRYLNGATQRESCPVTPQGGQTRGSETSQYPEEEKTNVIPLVVASEMGKVQTGVQWASGL